MEASWRWGVLLIVLTMVIHAAAVVTMAITGLSLRTRLETRNLSLGNLMAIQICVIGVIGLLLAVLHGIECGIWAAVYLWLGALASPADALLYSVDAMSTRGASGLTLQRPWQMMGALEAVNGMLLFGVSTAYVFRGDAGVVGPHRAPTPTMSRYDAPGRMREAWFTARAVKPPSLEANGTKTFEIDQNVDCSRRCGGFRRLHRGGDA